MKKYIVTGGAGFIGSALVRGLLALRDGSVEVIDNLSTGRAENLADVASQVDQITAQNSRRLLAETRQWQTKIVDGPWWASRKSDNRIDGTA
jgi:nucleoside-diphosphate-sugar epimerase